MSGDFTTEIAVRYTDVDTYGHVNNAVFATYCEEARIDYLEHVVGDAARSIDGTADESREESTGEDSAGIVVANLTLDFDRPLGPADVAEVTVRVPRLGEKSFPFEYGVRSADGLHATGETTMVAYDRGTQSARRIPDSWREPIAEFEGIPREGDRG